MALPSKLPYTVLVLVLSASAAYARMPDPLPVPEDLPDAYRTGWFWRQVGPVSADGMADVAVRGDDVAAVDLAGGVWISRDGARTWALVLPPLRSGLGGTSSDEELLLGVEARLDEVLGAVGDVSEEIEDVDALLEGEEIDDAVIEDVRTAVDDAVEEVRADVASDPLLSVEPPSPVPPRVWFTRDGALLVGRADGTWGALDAQSQLRQLLPDHGTALARGPEGWILGTTDGTYVSDDPLHWNAAERALHGTVVYDLAVDEAGVHAATDEGLWHSRDGRRWLGEGVLDEAVFALLPDVDTSRIWLATEEELRTGAEGGRRLLPRSATAPAGVQTIVRVGLDHLLTAGETGPWETIDGGRTWTPLARGLVDRATHSVVVGRDGRVWLAGEGGIYRLDEGEAPAAMAAVQDWVPIDALMDAALGRRGVRAEWPGNRWLAAAAPQLTIQARYNPGARLYYSANPDIAYDDDGEALVEPGGGAGRSADGLFTAGVLLTWTPRSAVDRSGELFVLGDRAEIYDVRSQDAAVALARLGTESAFDLARRVTDLYHARQALAAERVAVRERPLLEQVVHELRIAEVEATLDALTDGVVARWETP